MQSGTGTIKRLVNWVSPRLKIGLWPDAIIGNIFPGVNNIFPVRPGGAGKRAKGVNILELLDLSAVVHLDLSEIDAAIEKVNRLLALLEKAKETAGSQDKS